MTSPPVQGAPIVVQGLVRHFGSGDNLVTAVDGVDLVVEQGEILDSLDQMAQARAPSFAC